MGRLEGSSEWRPFVLPFSNREGGAPPEKLVVNLVLTGPGVVEIGPLQLVELNPADDLFADSGAWWNDRQAGLFGGIAGSGLGILGALIGWLGSRVLEGEQMERRGRRLSVNEPKAVTCLPFTTIDDVTRRHGTGRGELLPRNRLNNFPRQCRRRQQPKHD